ncbi:MAG: hypothetical protein RIR00_2037 [Pseudomonadota bacterium]|jgi:uncharacterized membrane protein YfcA
MEWALLLAGAFFAGLVDAVVGGGGLIQVPLLFNALPHQPPATLFGSNKLASVFGTSVATWRYSRRVRIPWRLVLPATLAALVSAYLGALTVAVLPPTHLRPLVLALLLGVAMYTFRRKDFGCGGSGRPSQAGDPLWAALIGAGIGFYDGFFGPGTGSFLIFLFIRVFALDFLHASVAAKVVNVATNLAALAFFLPHGHVLYLTGLGMAVCNISGAVVGSHLALRHGSRFIRQLFLLVVSLLILRFAVDTLL